MRQPAPPGCKFIHNYHSSPATCLLFDISRAALILLAVSDIAVAHESGVVLLLPQPPVDELLHQRHRQERRKNVDENDGLHAQNLPHFWLRASNPSPEDKPRVLKAAVKANHPSGSPKRGADAAPAPSRSAAAPAAPPPRPAGLSPAHRARPAAP